MNERFKKILLGRVAPLLNQGEIPRHVVMARRGENPWVAAWSTIARFPRFIVATDDAIIIVAAGWHGPESVVARLSRASQLGEPRFSPWGFLFLPLLSYRWIRVNNEKLWVMARDVGEIRAIDAAGVTAK